MCPAPASFEHSEPIFLVTVDRYAEEHQLPYQNRYLDREFINSRHYAGFNNQSHTTTNLPVVQSVLFRRLLQSNCETLFVA